ncbi:MAG: trypsin-like serine protease [Potamolinea sp.]
MMTSKRMNKKQFALPLVIGTSYLLSFTAAVLGFPQPESTQVAIAPLSPTDPRAQLDPNLVNVAPAKPPVSNSPKTPATESSLVTPVSFNLKTRIAQLGTAQKLRTAGTTPRVTRSSEGRAPNTESVIGTDQRYLINKTTRYPWRAMTKIYMTYPNRRTYMCSGALVSAKYVLTAGHCVYSKRDGGYATKIEVIPGLNGTYKPYGSAFATNTRTYANYTTSQDSNYDIALLTLDSAIGNSTGWLSYAYYPTLDGVTANIAGYPYDKDNSLKLYYNYGSITGLTAQRVSYTTDTEDGQSGSPVYRNVNRERTIFAVHTLGTSPPRITSNSGTRIDSTKFSDITAWIATGK